MQNDPETPSHRKAVRAPMHPRTRDSFPRMPLVSLRNVSIAFGGPAVLDHASLGIDRGERVCLLGRNGAGKSTLMSLLDRTLVPAGIAYWSL